jgi:polyhydroxybutyrate depolymerase
LPLWQQSYGCEAPSATREWQAVDWLRFTRLTWESCPRGRMTLDIHPGGHFIPHGWIGRQLDELLGRTPDYP